MQFTLPNLIDNKLGKEKDDNNSLHYMAINIHVGQIFDDGSVEILCNSDWYQNIMESAAGNKDHTAEINRKITSEKIILHLPNGKKLEGIEEAAFQLRENIRLVLIEAGPKDKVYEIPPTNSNTALMSTGDTAGGQEIPPKKDKSSFRKLTPEERSRPTGVHQPPDSASAAKQGLDKYFNRP